MKITKSQALSKVLASKGLALGILNHMVFMDSLSNYYVCMYAVSIYFCLHEYIREGKRGSFLSFAVSTNTLNGPFGHKTATRSAKISQHSHNMIKISIHIHVHEKWW